MGCWTIGAWYSKYEKWKTIALVMQPVVPTYRSGIRDGVLQAAEKTGGVQVIEIPFRSSGARPVRKGMESIDGIVTWADGRQAWIKEVSECGVPIVNCGGDWEPSKNLGAVAVQMTSLLDLAVSHCLELSISRLKFFGQIVSTSKGRLKFVEALTKASAPHGIENRVHRDQRESAQSKSLPIVKSPE